MRFVLAGSIALTLTSGCWRFGYDVQDKAAVLQPDAAARDASPSSAPDASLRDAGKERDAGPAFDAGRTPARDAGANDGAMPKVDAAMDASTGGAPPDAANPAPMDAGPAADAAADAAAADGGVSDACVNCAALTFSNGFEDSSGWSAPTQINGTLQRTTAQAHTGSSSLYALTGAPSSSKTVRQQTSAYANQTTGHVWARAWYLLPGSTVIAAATSLSTLRIGEGQSPFFGCAVAIRSDRVELTGVTTSFSAQTAFPRNLWTCVELHIYIDDDAGICEAYVDSQVAAQSTLFNSVRPNGYIALSVGVEYSNTAQTAVELYFDDVAASTERIHCP